MDAEGDLLRLGGGERDKELPVNDLLRVPIYGLLPRPLPLPPLPLYTSRLSGDLDLRLRKDGERDLDGDLILRRRGDRDWDIERVEIGDADCEGDRLLRSFRLPPLPPGT